MQLPNGKTRLDLVREGLADVGIGKKGRLIVSIDRLREDPRNERRTFRNMQGLIDSIKSVGLIEPITVSSEEGSDLFTIITGHRRYRAAKAAGLTQVEVLIRERDEERVRRQKSIISNVQREDVGPVEMAEALQSWMDEDDRIKTQDDLADLIGKDKAWVSGMLRILTLPPDLQTRVGTSQLSLSYDSMIRIARLEDSRQQRELTDALLSGATVKEIRGRIDEMKGKPKRNPATATSTEPAKPKRVYHTTQPCTVIVQGTTRKLTTDHVLRALREALIQAQEAREDEIRE
jgi:ParB family chromosome partitioning protein